MANVTGPSRPQNVEGESQHNGSIIFTWEAPQNTNVANFTLFYCQGVLQNDICQVNDHVKC